jgi:hypothetical protein
MFCSQPHRYGSKGVPPPNSSSIPLLTLETHSNMSRPGTLVVDLNSVGSKTGSPTRSISQSRRPGGKSPTSVGAVSL